MLVWWELNPLSLAPAFLKVFFVKFARWFNVGFYKYKPSNLPIFKANFAVIKSASNSMPFGMLFG